MQQLCAVLQRPDLANKGLSQNPEDQAALRRELEIEFEKRDFTDWTQLFSQVDACVEPLLSVSEAVEHPQLKAREVVTQVPLAGGKTQAQLACPIKFSAGLDAPRHVGAALGAHTVEVLQGLGYSEEQVAALKAAKVIA